MTGIISYQAFTNTAMKGKLIFYPRAIKERGEWYRFITHGFLHADWGHLLINMFVLYQFGEFVEYRFEDIFGQALGRIVYILFYITAIIISSVPSYFKHQENAFYSALGASGATSALVLIFVVYLPWHWFAFPPVPSIIFAAAYLWYSSYMAKHGRDNIGHDAHFWGAVYGVVFILSIGFLYDATVIENFLIRLLNGPQAPSFF